ncbi:MAG: adenylosuccinate lyase, partial [Chlamydiia bacterium]|nr:adenylosuccinate lyase [Chlamydiia bacterium]
LDCVSGIAVSAHKFATDLRLLANLKELEEPFEKTQVGSSAMPYKRNPMRSERICALARFVLSLRENPAYTASTQWLERSLDDSANRRLAISEVFLATDAILNILMNVTDGLLVYPKMIEKHVMQELPFMATENILMTCVQRGGDRQDLHERIRSHSFEAANLVKQEGAENPLLTLILNDPAFSLTQGDIDVILDLKKFVGLAPEQVSHFIEHEVAPVLQDYELEAEGIDLHV